MDETQIKNSDEELAWLQRRKKGIGSSDAPPLVLGKVFDTFPLDVYIDKKTPAKLDGTDNPNFRRGHTYEPLAIQMAEEQSGVNVWSPKTDRERYNDFQVYHPDLPVFADFDGFFEDGWILEAKSPKQLTFDKIEAEGLPDYYQVQAHHLAGIANFCDMGGVCHIPKFKGVRVVVYAPEDIRIIMVEIPFDADASRNVFTLCTSFWNDHIEKEIPPKDKIEPAMSFANKGGSYVPTNDGHLINAAERFLRARELAKAAERNKKNAAKILGARLDEIKQDKVLLPSGVKLFFEHRNGRKTLDKKALAAAHPQVDLDDFQKVGKQSRPLNVYGATEYGFDPDKMGGGDLAEEIKAFPSRSLGPELKKSEWEKLEAQALAFVETTNADGARVMDAYKKTEKIIKE